MPNGLLSDYQLRIALRLKKQGLKCREIGLALNKPKAMVKASIRLYRDRQREIDVAKAHAERIAIITKARAGLRRPSRTFEFPRTVTSDFCGDPSPDRSALAKLKLVDEDH